jgi:hypothetical protein
MLTLLCFFYWTAVTPNTPNLVVRAAVFVPGQIYKY